MVPPSEAASRAVPRLAAALGSPQRAPAAFCPRLALLGLAALVLSQVQGLFADLVPSAAFVPPRSLSTTRLAGVDSSHQVRAPSSRSWRSESPVALSGVARKTKKVKRAQNIIQVRRLGPSAYSSKPFQKEKKRMERIAQQDDWVNEFMSFSRPMPVGGEYVMPAKVVQDNLNRIYGDGPTLETLAQKEMEEAEPGSDTAGVSEEEFRTMNRMRKKETADKYNGPRVKRTRIRMRNIAGVSKYIGGLPTEPLGSEPGEMGVRGGSQSDAYQDVWMSGSSVRYNFDEEDTGAL